MGQLQQQQQTQQQHQLPHLLTSSHRNRTNSNEVSNGNTNDVSSCCNSCSCGSRTVGDSPHSRRGGNNPLAPRDPTAAPRLEPPAQPLYCINTALTASAAFASAAFASAARSSSTPQQVAAAGSAAHAAAAPAILQAGGLSTLKFFLKGIIYRLCHPEATTRQKHPSSSPSDYNSKINLKTASSGGRVSKSSRRSSSSNTVRL